MQALNEWFHTPTSHRLPFRVHSCMQIFSQETRLPPPPWGTLNRQMQQMLRAIIPNSAKGSESQQTLRVSWCIVSSTDIVLFNWWEMESPAVSASSVLAPLASAVSFTSFNWNPKGRLDTGSSGTPSSGLRRLNFRRSVLKYADRLQIPRAAAFGLAA